MTQLNEIHPPCHCVGNCVQYGIKLLHLLLLLAHLSQRIPMLRHPSAVVRPLSTFSNMNIPATSWPITMKFYQKHHWDGGKAALGFASDWIKTLVFMATGSSHRVIMEKMVLPLFLSCFHQNLFILAGNDDMHGSSKEFEILPNWTTDCGVSCP